jgi:hypothetical protein
MPFYASSEQFYTSSEALFERLLEINPGAAQPVAKARLLIRFKCTDPVVSFLINGRQKPVSVVFGENRVRPEIDVETTTDTLHQIMLGQLSLSNALSANLLRVRGSVWKVISLSDLFHECQNLYPEVLEDQGLIG